MCLSFINPLLLRKHEANLASKSDYNSRLPTPEPSTFTVRPLGVCVEAESRVGAGLSSLAVLSGQRRRGGRRLQRVIALLPE